MEPSSHRIVCLTAAQSPASPCTGVCQLDAADICLGCGRSLAEIAAWSQADGPRRRQIVGNALRRQSALTGSQK